MALSLGEKTVRVLRFLQGLALPRAHSALRPHGFTQNTLDEGWALLRGASGSVLSIPASTNVSPDLYRKLDEWENFWFPIIQAVLTRHHPAQAERVFLNLSQTDGPAVAVSVGLLLQRLAALRADKSEDAKAASALLLDRGVTANVIAEAEALLKQVGTLAPEDSQPPPSPETVEAAENALWAWYLEWSAIARRAISDRRVLRALGFLTPSRSGSSKDDEVEEEPTETGISEAAE